MSGPREPRAQELAAARKPEADRAKYMAAKNALKEARRSRGPESHTRKGPKYPNRGYGEILYLYTQLYIHKRIVCMYISICIGIVPVVQGR